MIIAVDFDATLAEHIFPQIGREVAGAIHWCKMFQQAGAKLIMWTVRQDGPEYGPVRTEAVEWCRERGLVFDAVNNDLEVYSWTQGNKIFANLYIDDAAFGCPLITWPDRRPVVDWSIVGPEVMKRIKAAA